MSTVVNLKEFDNRFQTLGWNVSSSNLVEFLNNHPAITAVELIKYLDALLANPAGMNDQTITGVTTTDANTITAALEKIGVVVS